MLELEFDDISVEIVCVFKFPTGSLTWVLQIAPAGSELTPEGDGVPDSVMVEVVVECWFDAVKTVAVVEGEGVVVDDDEDEKEVEEDIEIFLGESAFVNV